ncbi:3-phosphoshikimate 1-carboxyvinyltransferase [candidate division KSB3 bacterium]|uniref:3-phosphoshikimate 1-carboxyvinyltransferase n=1 Tax=candidate division KSB3 bacterium TaxID=2044937 RepID=A0A2G6E8B0_9BACT|nr:MAG: 3-phosphoshikimate 1-carboxyvinyltransferase [candidate division KSB3 bacterium]PIE30643.1 MAG: 3-phosphoshikimate 1-carboxyvinyltransferase [candidate division KSB3 bacterium]
MKEKHSKARCSRAWRSAARAKRITAHDTAMRHTRTIRPAGISGQLNAPASKSDMVRAVAVAALTDNAYTILHPSYCEDALAACRVVEALGVQLLRSPEQLQLFPGRKAIQSVLNCGESALCIRMFASIAALGSEPTTLTGHGSLRSRPLTMIEQPLRDLGVCCHSCSGVQPLTIQGPLQAGRTVVDASGSSQFLSGLLMALPLCKGRSEIIVPALVSHPYVEMTLHLLRTFGIRIEHDRFQRFFIQGAQQYTAVDYQIEGDWSGASCLLTAGALAGRIRVTNLRHDSLQADTAILEALRRAGASVDVGEHYVEVAQAPLSGFTFDATECPDLFPALVALAVSCVGKSVIYGAERLAVKESDRGQALLTEFRKMGAALERYPDRLEILGRTFLDGGTIDSYNDHRIAMACAVAALGSRSGVTIEAAECVAKSYPEFFDDLERVMI